MGSVLSLVAICNLICWLVALGYALRVRLPIYHPVSFYLAYHLVGFVFRPIAIALTGHSFTWSRVGIIPSDLSLLESCFFNNCALFAFVFLPPLINPQLIRETRIPPQRLRVGNKIGFFVGALMLIGLGLYGNFEAYWSADSGDSIQAYDTVADSAGGQRLVGVSGYQLALAEFLPATLIVSLLIAGPTFFPLSLVTAYSGLRIIVGAQRLSFVVVAVAAFFIGQMRKGKIGISKLALAAALIGATIFLTIGTDRLAARRLLNGSISLAQAIEARNSNKVETVDFQEFDIASIIFDIVPDRTGFNYGSQYLRIFIWPIPRQLWPEKPVYTSLVDVTPYGNFYGLTWSLQGDLYSNFGYPSLVIGMTLIGYALYALHKRATTTRSAFRFSVYWLLVVYLSTLYRDGGVTIAYFLGFSALACYILIRIGRLRLERI